MLNENKAVLLCLDLEKGSEELALNAIKYVRCFGQPLHILHINPLSMIKEEDAIKERFEKMVEKVIKGVKVETIALRCGETEEEIVRYVREKGIGLVILGHRHKAKRERIHVGSTVRTILSMAPGPILVLPLNRR